MDQCSLNNPRDCIADWMANNFLQLSESKSKLVIFGPLLSVTTLTNNLNQLSAYVNPFAKNVGYFLTSTLINKYILL